MREFRIIEGDALAVARTLPSESVQCVVTSPPYFGLRDYGSEGQIGLERTPDEYVARLVEVFREMRRVLTADGVLWLNLGDSYATGGGKANSPGGGEQGKRFAERAGLGRAQVPDGKNPNAGVPTYQPNRMPLPGLKPKDLIGIPWMVAFALRADGWYLRSDIIWHKPNPMPESVTDRPTKAHEYLFLLSKSASYYYDAEAIKEPVTESTLRDSRIGTIRPFDLERGEGYGVTATQTRRYARNATGSKNGRNRRTVWTVTTQPFAGAHFATFPPDLIEPCVLAGSREGDTVYDPFTGSGTTGLVSLRLNRDFIGSELNPEYAAMARRRIAGDAPLLNTEAAA